MQPPKTIADSPELKIIAEIHELFARYGPTFADLVVGKRSDTEALLQFYDVPLRFIGETFHLVMNDAAAIIGQHRIGGELERLRLAHFGASTLDYCDVTVLNSQAAIVDAVWLQRDDTGVMIARFGVIYLLALTPTGWRITSAVNTSE